MTGVGSLASRAAAVAALVIVAVVPATASEESAAAKFYAGKQIDLIIGSAPGGGYDLYARVLAHHMDRHIPGHPGIVPRNMPGAGSNKAAGYLYSVAPKDGSTMGAIYSGAVMEALLGDKSKLQHDPAKFIYLGSANNEVGVCVLRPDAPAKSFKEMLQKEVTIAATQAGSPIRDFPVVMINVLGAKINLVSGYPGSKEMTVAVERNEAQGMCGYFWSSLKAQKPDWITGGKMKILVQEGLKPHPELKKLGVPLSLDFAKTAEDRQVLELIYGQLVFGRPYVLPPGVPQDRAAALRKAFDATMKDPQFLADAEKARMEIMPVSGEEVQALVKKMFRAPANIVARAKNALVYKK